MEPLKLGGANGQHNLTICCKPCNTKKSKKPFTEWLEYLPENRRRAAALWFRKKHQRWPDESQPSLVFEFAG